MNESNKKITIVLDTGHGATYNKWNTVDPDALGSDGKHEKDYPAEVSSQLGSDLEKRYGYNIVYTRKADVTAKQKHLAWQVDPAHNKNADYFISIHLGSSSTTKKRLSAYYWVKGNYFSKEGKNFAESIVNAVTSRCFSKTVVKAANHYVTRNISMPAILVECGNIQYSDNKDAIKNEKFI